ncbi:MAG: 23S rRNA (adenine(2030)-N(6))-methyltransferase RlmJ [Hyphomicrobium sp.]|jgi:23S rRNA (adenine2030-N6)-methyltransferase
MNYRHVYHAGNFADVLKHAVLALVIEHLKLKPAPFRVVDTHAGIGLYDLTSEEAQKTAEWKDGIGRVLAAKRSPAVETALAPYLAIVDEEHDGGAELARYPGSPLIARRLLREGDTLVVNEAHPADHETLQDLFHRDKQVKVLGLDGWTALKSLLPPKERRGLVLVDPPFEEPGEFQRMADGLDAAARRFATGTVMMWYPIKDQRAVDRFRRSVTALAIPKLYSIEVTIRAVRTTTELSGSGLLILNPPFTLPGKLDALLPFLAKTLARGQGAGFRADWLTGEHASPA